MFANKWHIYGTYLNGLGSRIVNIDHYSIDIASKGHIYLLTIKTDRGRLVGL